MKYADGFVLPVPRKNLDACTSLARKAGAIWKEHGALECVEEDVHPGEHTSFPQSVKLEDDVRRPGGFRGEPVRRPHPLV